MTSGLRRMLVCAAAGAALAGTGIVTAAEPTHSSFSDSRTVLVTVTVGGRTAHVSGPTRGSNSNRVAVHPDWVGLIVH